MKVLRCALRLLALDTVRRWKEIPLNCSWVTVMMCSIPSLKGFTLNAKSQLQLLFRGRIVNELVRLRLKFVPIVNLSLTKEKGLSTRTNVLFEKKVRRNSHESNKKSF